MTLDRRHFVGLAGAAAFAGTARAALPGTAPEPKGPWTSQGDIRRAGGQLHYGKVGQGDPIVLMPKVGGWIADWRGVAAVLAPGATVIAIDPPGHGGSTMLGAPPYVQQVAESAAMVVAALEEMGIERFAFAGNSLGGVIGVTIAAMWPERLTKLALVSVSLNASLGHAGLAKLDAGVDPAEWTRDWLPRPRSAAVVDKFGTINPQINLEQNASRAQAGRWVRPSERGVALAGTDVKLSRIECPTLLVHADRGHYTRFEAIGRERIRNVQVAHVPDSGSFIHQEKPEETGKILADFFN